MADFLGELLVRENINKFAEILTKVPNIDYAVVVNKYKHTRFGMRMKGDGFIFKFHINLVQKILTEDFKRQVDKKKK